MQTAINIFTIIGSLIGIISLLMTMFSSIHNYNTKKWEKLSSIISSVQRSLFGQASFAWS